MADIRKSTKEINGNLRIALIYIMSRVPNGSKGMEVGRADRQLIEGHKRVVQHNYLTFRKEKCNRWWTQQLEKAHKDPCMQNRTLTEVIIHTQVMVNGQRKEGLVEAAKELKASRLYMTGKKIRTRKLDDDSEYCCLQMPLCCDLIIFSGEKNKELRTLPATDPQAFNASPHESTGSSGSSSQHISPQSSGSSMPIQAPPTPPRQEAPQTSPLYLPIQGPPVSPSAPPLPSQPSSSSAFRGLHTRSATVGPALETQLGSRSYSLGAYDGQWGDSGGSHRVYLTAQQSVQHGGGGYSAMNDSRDTNSSGSVGGNPYNQHPQYLMKQNSTPNLGGPHPPSRPLYPQAPQQLQQQRPLQQQQPFLPQESTIPSHYVPTTPTAQQSNHSTPPGGVQSLHSAYTPQLYPPPPRPREYQLPQPQLQPQPQPQPPSPQQQQQARWQDQQPWQAAPAMAAPNHGFPTGGSAAYPLQQMRSSGVQPVLNRPRYPEVHSSQSLQRFVPGAALSNHGRPTANAAQPVPQPRRDENTSRGSAGYPVVGNNYLYQQPLRYPASSAQYGSGATNVPQPMRGPESASARTAKLEAELQRMHLQMAAGAATRVFQEYSGKTIGSACGGFSPSRVIGQGAYGTVYRAELAYTPVAVKCMKVEGSATVEEAVAEFKKEGEMHVSLHHPNVLLLIGHCSSPMALVYEFMENGSLFDRLVCKNGTAPLSWHHRFNIFRDAARALVYLHSRSPPIIHLDIKPANILLDRNMCGKLGDVGLAQHLITLDQESFQQKSMAVGTFGYIDPDFCQMGQLSTSSDVYSLGQVLWDILAGFSKSGRRGRGVGAIGNMDNAVEKGDKEEAMKHLDPTAGKWPVEVAFRLCQLASACSGRRGKRPDLRTGVMEVLVGLQEAVDRELVVEESKPKEERRTSRWGEEHEAPSQFYCPITQDLMIDPVIDCKSHTYERASIEEWYSSHNTSPCTNEVVEHKDLIPNITLRSLIQDWKASRKI